MPTWAALDADPVTGDSIPTAFLELEGRTVELRKSFAGATAPTSPQVGQVWIDTSATPHVVKVYADIGGGNAWQPLGPLSRLPASINADPSTGDDRTAPFEHKALRLENVGSLPGAVAGNAGLLVYRTSDGEVYVADQPVSGAWKGMLSVKVAGSYDTVELDLSGDLGNDATNPPTKKRKGVLEGWLFDATNEKRTFAFVVPKNWSANADLKLHLDQVLDAAETAGDDIEWSGEVRSLAPAEDKVSKAATALVDATTDIGADVDGIDDGGGPHRTTLTIDHDDATNAVAIGNLLLITDWRKTVGGAGLVAGTVVFRATLAYTQTPRHERI